MSYSFYGGKQGRTYNLVAHYDSIYDMVMNFQQGGSYTDANYNEYVIIDTFVNKNEKFNRENGIIYRRGLNYSEEFNPNHIPAINPLTGNTFNEDSVVSVTLMGEEGTLYQDTDDVTGQDILVCTAQVPRYKHFEYILTTDEEDPSVVNAEIHSKDFKREDDRVERTLQGEEGVRYTDENPGMFGLSWTGLVPKYSHYSYYLYYDNGVVKASISPGKDLLSYGGNPIPPTYFNIDWSNFVTNPGGGAVYVGQIVGPQGESPELEMTDWETFERDFLHGDNTSARKGEIRAFRRPGYEDGIKYNDDIQYGWATVKDAQGNVDYVVISIDIPYTVFKYRADSVSAYGPVVHEVEELPEERPEPVTDYYYLIEEDAYYIWDDTRTVPPTIVEVPVLPELDIDPEIYYFWDTDDMENRGTYLYDVENEQWNKVDVPDFVNRPGFVKTDVWAVTKDENGWHYFDILRERADSQGHLYYKDYEIKIPKGIHGTDLKNLEIDNEYEVTYQEIDYDVLDPSKSIAEQEQGVVIDHHVATLKVIKETELVQQRDAQQVSFLKITYYTYDEIEPWVIIVEELPEENIELDAYYFLDVEDEGERGYYRYDGTTWNQVEEPQSQKTYHTEDLPIKRIDRFELSNTGQLIVRYLNGTNSSTQNVGVLRSINSISLNENHQLVITYNTIDSQTSRPSQTVIEYQLRSIEEVGITGDKTLDETKQFYVKYDVADTTTGEDTYIVSEVLNDVVDIKLYGDNIVVLYSDPAKRRALPQDKRYEIPYTGTDWTYEDGDVAGTRKLYWHNLGPVLVGQHVFGNFDSYEQLEEEYPYGFDKDEHGEPVPEQEHYAGWVASVVEYDSSTPPQIVASSIYAYDYAGSMGWYEISQLDVQGLDPRKVVIISETDDVLDRPEYYDALLADNGYWFVLEDVIVAKDMV